MELSFHSILAGARILIKGFFSCRFEIVIGSFMVPIEPFMDGVPQLLSLDTIRPDLTQKVSSFPRERLDGGR